MMFITDMEFILQNKVAFTKDIGKMAKLKEKAQVSIKTGINIQVISFQIREKVMEYKIMKMDNIMKEDF